jgi:hypothetical protein
MPRSPGDGEQGYRPPMEEAAARRCSVGAFDAGPLCRGLVGGWFVRTLEPPVKPRFKMKARENRAA